MTIITLTNSKGGTGKTTVAVLIATELARRLEPMGRGVTLIDADPRQPISRWKERWEKRGTVPSNLIIKTIYGAEGGEGDEVERLTDLIQNQDKSITIIDTEGIASQTADSAAMMSDLVLIPLKPQQQDADAAIATIRRLKSAEKILRRTIPYRLVLTMTAAIKSRQSSHIESQLSDETKTPTLKTQVMQRDAFSALFTYGADLHDLDERAINNLERAKQNAAQLTAEIIDTLKTTSAARKAA
ncbi:MAG: division plane positioning ATPase MipZ [Hyphomonadaceae bacterium]|jgi:chromosome partitioning protein|nr:ParA family protein [Aquidulcibacter sp.]